MLTIFIIGAAIIIINGLCQYHRWQLESERLDRVLLETSHRMQAERIQELERERARLHLQLLAHLSEPGQNVNVYRN
jgi:hypothetical protein